MDERIRKLALKQPRAQLSTQAEARRPSKPLPPLPLQQPLAGTEVSVVAACGESPPLPPLPLPPLVLSSSLSLTLSMTETSSSPSLPLPQYPPPPPPRPPIFLPLRSPILTSSQPLPSLSPPPPVSPLPSSLPSPSLPSPPPPSPPPPPPSPPLSHSHRPSHFHPQQLHDDGADSPDPDFDPWLESDSLPSFPLPPRGNRLSDVYFTPNPNPSPIFAYPSQAVERHNRVRRSLRALAQEQFRQSHPQALPYLDTLQERLAYPCHQRKRHLDLSTSAPLGRASSFLSSVSASNLSAYSFSHFSSPYVPSSPTHPPTADPALTPAPVSSSVPPSTPLQRRRQLHLRDRSIRALPDRLHSSPLVGAAAATPAHRARHPKPFQPHKHAHSFPFYSLDPQGRPLDAQIAFPPPRPRRLPTRPTKQQQQQQRLPQPPSPTPLQRKRFFFRFPRLLQRIRFLTCVCQNPAHPSLSSISRTPSPPLSSLHYFSSHINSLSTTQTSAQSRLSSNCYHLQCQGRNRTTSTSSPLSWFRFPESVPREHPSVGDRERDEVRRSGRISPRLEIFRKQRANRKKALKGGRKNYSRNIPAKLDKGKQRAVSPVSSFFLTSNRSHHRRRSSLSFSTIYSWCPYCQKSIPDGRDERSGPDPEHHLHRLHDQSHCTRPTHASSPSQQSSVLFGLDRPSLDSGPSIQSFGTYPSAPFETASSAVSSPATPQETTQPPAPNLGGLFTFQHPLRPRVRPSHEKVVTRSESVSAPITPPELPQPSSSEAPVQTLSSPSLSIIPIPRTETNSSPTHPQNRHDQSDTEVWSQIPVATAATLVRPSRAQRKPREASKERRLPERRPLSSVERDRVWTGRAPFLFLYSHLNSKDLEAASRYSIPSHTLTNIPAITTTTAALPTTAPSVVTSPGPRKGTKNYEGSFGNYEGYNKGNSNSNGSLSNDNSNSNDIPTNSGSPISNKRRSWSFFSFTNRRRSIAGQSSIAVPSLPFLAQEHSGHTKVSQEIPLYRPEHPEPISETRGGHATGNGTQGTHPLYRQQQQFPPLPPPSPTKTTPVQDPKPAGERVRRKRLSNPVPYLKTKMLATHEAAVATFTTSPIMGSRRHNSSNSHNVNQSHTSIATSPSLSGRERVMITAPTTNRLQSSSQMTFSQDKALPSTPEMPLRIGGGLSSHIPLDQQNHSSREQPQSLSQSQLLPPPPPQLKPLARPQPPTSSQTQTQAQQTSVPPPLPPKQPRRRSFMPTALMTSNLAKVVVGNALSPSAQSPNTPRSPWSPISGRGSGNGGGNGGGSGSGGGGNGGGVTTDPQDSFKNGQHEEDRTKKAHTKSQPEVLSMEQFKWAVVSCCNEIKRRALMQTSIQEGDASRANSGEGLVSIVPPTPPTLQPSKKPEKKKQSRFTFPTLTPSPCPEPPETNDTSDSAQKTLQALLQVANSAAMAADETGYNSNAHGGTQAGLVSESGLYYHHASQRSIHARPFPFLDSSSTLGGRDFVDSTIPPRRSNSVHQSQSSARGNSGALYAHDSHSESLSLVHPSRSASQYNEPVHPHSLPPARLRSNLSQSKLMIGQATEAILQPLSMERLLDLLLCTLSAGPDQWIPWHLYDFFVKPQGQKYNDLVELLPTQSQKIIRAIMETVDAFLDYEVSVVQQQHRIQPPTQPQPPQLPPQQTTKAFLAGVMTSNNSGAVSGGTLPSTLALAKRSVAAQSHLRSKSDIYGPPRAVAAAMPVGTAAPHFNRPPLTESRNHHGGNLGNGDRIHEDIAIRARKRRSLLDTLAPLVFRPRQDSSGIHGSAHSYFDRPLQGQGSLSGYSSRTLPHRPTIQHLPPTSSIQGSTQATTDGLLPMNDRVRKRNSIAAGMSLSLSSSPMTNMTPTASGTVGTGSAIMMVGSQQTPMATAPGAVAMGREQEREREAGIRAFENLVSAFEEEYHAHKPSLGVGSSPLTLDSQRSIHGVLGIVGVSTPDLRTTASTTPGLSGATSHGPGVGRYNSVMSSTLPPLPNRPSRSMPDAMAISRATTSGIADSDEVDVNGLRSLSLPPWRKQSQSTLNSMGSLSRRQSYTGEGVERLPSVSNLSLTSEREGSYVADQGGRIGVRPKIRPAMVPRTRSKSESREKSHCSTSSSSSSNDGPSSIAEREAAVEAIARARALKRNSLPYGRSMARLSSSWTVWEDHVLVVEEEEIVIKDTSDEDSIAGGREKRQQQQQKPLSFQPTPAPQLPAAPVAHHIQWSRGRMEERQVQTVVESLQHSSTQPTKSDSPSTAQRDGHEGDEGWTFIQGESTLDPLIAKVHGSVGGTQPSSSPTEKASGETLSSTPVSRVKRRQKTISGTFGSLTRLVSSRRGGAGEGSSKGI